MRGNILSFFLHYKILENSNVKSHLSGVECATQYGDDRSLDLLIKAHAQQADGI